MFGTDHKVFMKDEALVEKKLSAIIEGGTDNLKMVFDFDFTISSFWRDRKAGKREPSCFAVVEQYSRFPDSYREHAAKNLKHYYAIEIDPTVSVEDKTKAMEEWARSAMEMLREVGCTRNDIKQSVAEHGMALREGAREMFDLAASSGVPVMIFSAGIGNVIEQALAVNGIPPDTSTTHVFANELYFGEKDDSPIDHFSSPLLHSMNKCGSTLKDTEFVASSQARGNLVVSGDSMGDLKMPNGLKHDVMLTIGFLNDREDERLQLYMDNWDIVLVGDGDFAVHKGIVEHAMKKKRM